MARRHKPRPPLSDELTTLFREHPRAEEWSAEQLAEHLGRNSRSVKENPVYRKALAERRGVALPEPDLRVLSALAALDTGEGRVSSQAVAEDAEVSYLFCRRRLSGLVAMGYVRSVRGTDAGYTLTPEGRKLLRSTQLRKRRKA